MNRSTLEALFVTVVFTFSLSTFAMNVAIFSLVEILTSSKIYIAFKVFTPLVLDLKYLHSTASSKGGLIHLGNESFFK